MQDFLTILWDLESVIQAFFAGLPFLATVSAVVTLVTRFIFAPLALLVFIRCLWPLMSGGQDPKPWAYLVMANGPSYPLVHWENAIGRGKACDVKIDLPVISRNHAVISRKKEDWYITDLGSKAGVMINGKPCTGTTLFQEGDTLDLGGVKLTMFSRIDERDLEPPQRSFATRMGELAAKFKPGATLLAIILFQFLGLIETLASRGADFSILIPIFFLLLFLVELLYYVFTRGRGRRYIEPELLAFFLCGIGLFVVAATNPAAMLKQFVAMLLGLGLFSVLSYFLDNLERARTARYVFAVGALLLLAVNLILAPTRFGARNWIAVGPFSLQPSEFVKVAFVFAGGATLDRVLTANNFFRFMVFAGACIGGLVLMRDFGGALIFFLAFIVMAFMRSGDMRSIAIVTAAAAMGALIVVSFMPYIASRFAAWRHAWDFVDAAGYQQTRTMIYTASGGLFGVGSGKGYLRYVAAADTDLVFGLVAEEWGLIIALICALTPLILAIFAATSVKASRSAFYAIVACGAAVILLAQAALNVFGSLDILPLTGVTLPFVSNGGSSMVACWGLLACIKSIDERHRAQTVPQDAQKGKKSARRTVPELKGAKS